MLALKIIGIIAAVIALIMLIPIGADIGYESGVFSLSAKVCGVLLQLFPKPPEDENAQKKEDKPKNNKKSKKTDEFQQGRAFASCQESAQAFWTVWKKVPC